MDVREIQNILRGRLGPYVHYKGIFTSDKLPRYRYNVKPIVFIANTLSSQTDISVVGHWVAFYMSFYPKKLIIFFDSYGLSPHFYSRDLSDWMQQYSQFHIQEFGHQIQPDKSQKCGLYVLQFIHYVSYFGIHKYKRYYSDTYSTHRLNQNDQMVTNYVFKHILKVNNCSQWKMKIKGNKHAITYEECLTYLRYGKIYIMLILKYL